MKVDFKAEPYRVGSHTIVRFPKSVDGAMPSRGMVMVSGTVNDTDFILPLEPDGEGGHWLDLSDELIVKSGIIEGETVHITATPVDDWQEPEVPGDILEAILEEGLLNTWNSLTTKARWEWIRWIRSTKNSETRKKRIRVGCSKLSQGERRPCCFNSSGCTVPEVSKSGVLIGRE